MEDSFPMTGGDGEYSYVKNSSHQKEAADLAKAMLVEAIFENLDVKNALPASDSFRIADLGCSTGPNTFIAVKNIIDAVAQKYSSCLQLIPEFQVFFNDHVSNDFNVLFTNLPSDRQYFASGVPGSFHGRLFAKASLDFVYSAFALHWLSRVPQELRDLNSPAYNKGRICFTNAPNEVGEAYSAQYARDMESFLGARATELVPGGLIAFLIPARPDGTLPGEATLGRYFLPLESSLLDLANEGKISKGKVDSFNLPIYAPSDEELRALIKQNGCFSIVRFAKFSSKCSTQTFKVHQLRAGMEDIIVKHFGSEIIEQVFEQYTKRVAENPPIDLTQGHGLFVLLKRNH